MALVALTLLAMVNAKKGKGKNKCKDKDKGTGMCKKVKEILEKNDFDNGCQLGWKKFDKFMKNKCKVTCQICTPDDVDGND